MKPPRKPDRRVLKTKRALRDALFASMMEKGYDATHIADIAERANVGRSTFYAHFADKEDLLQESLRGLKQHLVEAAKARGLAAPHPGLRFSLPMLEHVLEVRPFIRALASKGGATPVQKHLHWMLTELVREELETARSELPGPLELVAEFVVGAFLAVCFWWLDGHEELGAEEVDRVFRGLALPGLRARSDAGS